MERRELTAWALAATFLATAGISFATRTVRPAEPKEDSAGLMAENRRLRTAVAQLRNESVGLRIELDRMLVRPRQSSGAPPGPGGVASGGSSPQAEDPAVIAKRVETIAADIERLSGDLGSSENFKAITNRISQLQAMGPEALPAMRDALTAATDPMARRVLASLLAMRGGATEQQLIFSEAQKETNPEIKQALLADSNAMGGDAGRQAEHELRSMVTAPEPSTRANAIRNLSDLSDTDTLATVEKALATDASESVRLAALDALMRDPDHREQALAAAARDASPRLRSIAECRARLSELESQLLTGE